MSGGNDHGPWPAVDVVVATRNRPELLREAVAAVLAQTWPGLITVFVVFDQSDPDPSIALLARDPATSAAAERRIVVLANNRQPGLAGARNSGIEAGEAPWVAFCDDDDLWLAEKTARQMAELGWSELGWSEQGCSELGGGRCDTVVSGIVVDYRGELTPRVPRADDLRLASLVRRRVMEAHPSTVMVRRSALVTEIGLVDEEIPGSYGEDFDWIMRAAEHGAIAVAAEPLVKVRWGGSQFSQDWDVMVRAIDYGLIKHPAFSADRRALARLLGRRAFALAALRRRGALKAAMGAAATHPAERRAYLAAAVALRLVSAEKLLDLAHRRGHGI